MHTTDTKKRSAKNLFFSGVIVLTVANILVKSVGLISKIALNRVVGSIGAGYYSSAYEIYAFLYVISTAGLPVAISIMVSKSIASGKIKEANKIFDTSFIVFMTMGLALSGLMIAFSGALAEFLGAPETKLCIITIAPTVLFICISSCIRGYFQGFQLMGPTAISQFIEALGKVGIGIGCALYAKSKGFPDYTVAAYTVIGVTAGVFLGMVYLYIRKIRFKEAEYLPDIALSADSRKSRQIVKEMFTIGIPVTVSSTVLSLTTVLDTLMIQPRLLKGGLDPVMTRICYGDYTSLVISMFNLPTILLYPIANALVPLISGAVAGGNEERKEKIRSFSIRIIAIIALPCAVGMSVFSAPILNLLMFKQDSVDRAAPWLSVAAISVVFLGVIAVTNAFLNSAGKQNLPIISMICGALVKLIANSILIERVGIIGAPIATVLCYIAASSINIFFVIKHVGKLPDIFGVFISPFICTVFSVGSSAVFYMCISQLINVKACTLLSIGLAVVLYAVFILKSRTVTEEEIMLFPYGVKIIRMLEKLKIIGK